MDDENNSAVDKKRRRKRIAKKTGKCSYCPPHKVENASNYSKWGKAKPKKNDHRSK